MGKRIVALVACMVMVAGAAACGAGPAASFALSATASPVAIASPITTTESPTATVPATDTPVSTIAQETLEPDPTEEPEPIPEYNIPGIQKAGLTNEEFYRINLMLVGISGSMLYQKPINTLSSEDCLIYGFYVLNDLYGANHLPAVIIQDESGSTSVDPRDMKTLVESAFGNRFDSSCKETSYSEVQLIENRYNFYLMEGDARYRPFVYQIVKTGNDTYTLRFDVVGMHFQYSIYSDKVEATIKRNENSIYGYTLMGWKVLKSESMLFDHAKASSTHAAIGNMAFAPKNVLDGDENTFWLSNPEEVSWLKVEFDKPTAVTGINIDMDYINEHYSELLSEFPSTIRMELSDGTMLQLDDTYTLGFHSFGRRVTIAWIKISFPSEVSDSGQARKVGRYVLDVYAY